MSSWDVGWVVLVSHMRPISCQIHTSTHPHVRKRCIKQDPHPIFFCSLKLCKLSWTITSIPFYASLTHWSSFSFVYREGLGTFSLPFVLRLNNASNCVSDKCNQSAAKMQHNHSKWLDALDFIRPRWRLRLTMWHGVEKCDSHSTYLNNGFMAVGQHQLHLK